MAPPFSNTVMTLVSSRLEYIYIIVSYFIATILVKITSPSVGRGFAKVSVYMYEHGTVSCCTPRSRAAYWRLLLAK